MSQIKSIKRIEKSNRGEGVEVLYQKMGDRWFAFSMQDEEVFVGTISPEQLFSEDGAVNANERPTTARMVRSRKDA